MPLRTRICISLTSAALIMVCSSLPSLASMATDKETETRQEAPVASRLQVSGSRSAITIEADHADLQSALKALFVQSGKQFDVEAGVAGQITLRLSAQSLEACLQSICRQTFMKYHIDPVTGVFHFEQDTVAIKASFVRLESLNAELRNQLRTLGLELAADTGLSDAAKSAQTKGVDRSLTNGGPGGRAMGKSPGQGGLSGGFGGGAIASGNIAGESVGKRAATAAPVQPQAAAKIAQNGVSQYSAADRPGTVSTDYLSTDAVMQILQASGNIAEPQSVTQFNNSYRDMLNRSGLVAINTQGAAVAMTDVLTELAKQANVSLLVDPLVPRGPKFRITLTLPATTLTEALNLILPPARLRWRIMNGAVYITTSPDFRIFYGSNPSPYYSFGNASQGTRSSLDGQQNGQNANGQSPP